MLDRYRAPSGVFAEIGGDEPGEFHRRCAGLFGKMLNVEVAEDASADYRSVNELPANQWTYWRTMTYWNTFQTFVTL